MKDESENVGLNASPDAVRWAACPGAEPTGDPMMLVGPSCHLLPPLLECDQDKVWGREEELVQPEGCQELPSWICAFAKFSILWLLARGR